MLPPDWLIISGVAVLIAVLIGALSQFYADDIERLMKKVSRAFWRDLYPHLHSKLLGQ